MSAANVLTVQGYYYLYALFFDYPLNNDFHIGREEAERIRKLLRQAQPILGLSEPYKLDWRLRLFTQRQSMERFPPERIHELLRQLRRTVELIPTPLPHPLRRDTDPGVARRRNVETRKPAAPESRPAPEPRPRSPVEFRLTA